MTMKRSLAIAVLSQGSIFVFGFANAVLSAQVLGTAGKGQLAIYMVALDLGAALMIVGMNQALQYHASREDFASQKTLNTTVLFACICAALFFLLVQATFLIGHGDRVLPAPYNSMGFRVLITLHFFLLFGWMLLGSILNSYKLFKEGYRVSLISIGTLCVLYLGLFALQKLDVVQVTVVYFYVCLVLVALQSVVLGLRVYVSGILEQGLPRSRGLLQRKEVLTLVSFGLFPWMSLFMMRAVVKLDYWFVEAFIGLDALGQYSVAANIGDTLYLVPNTIGVVILSFIADPETRDDSTHRTATLSRLFFPTMLIGALVVSTISPELFAFAFGPDFRDAGPLFNMMLWGIVPFSLGTIFIGYLTGAKQLKPVLLAAAMGLTLTVILDLTLIPRMGAMGAALTRAITFGTMTVYLVFCFRRTSGLPLERFLLPARSDIEVIKKLLRRGRSA